MEENKRKRIVAEVSKTWRNGLPESGNPELLSELFERAIAVNEERGYLLESWQFTSQAYTRSGLNDVGYFFEDGYLNETIVAVFVLDPSKEVTSHD